MSLKERLFEDLKTAMKQKDGIKKEIIQIVRAGVLQIEKDGKVELDDGGVIDVITKQIKKLNDVLPDFEKGGREDLIEKAKAQIDILSVYLPKQLSPDEIEAAVLAAISELGALGPKDMGKVMAYISPGLKGKADNKTVSEIVKNKLSTL